MAPTAQAIAAGTSAGLPIRELAAALGESFETLRYWQQIGMPCIKPGSRGRGNAALYDPAAVRAWASEREAAASRSLASDTALACDIEQTSGRMLYNIWLCDGRTGQARLIAAFMAESHKLRWRLGVEPLEAADVPKEIKEMQAATAFSHQR